MPNTKSPASTDPIADMLTRMRNAIAVGQDTVEIPTSIIKQKVLDIFKKHGFIDGYHKSKLSPGMLEIILNTPESNSPINQMVRVSKPGRRQYVKSYNIPVVRGGRGLVVISTSAGLLPGHVAKQRGLGGELICKVW
jgi:small subunit ribosomal protein S8